jgi:hypothetical protein
MKRMSKGIVAIGIALVIVLNGCGTREGTPNNIVERDDVEQRGVSGTSNSLDNTQSKSDTDETLSDSNNKSDSLDNTQLKSNTDETLSGSNNKKEEVKVIVDLLRGKSQRFQEFEVITINKGEVISINGEVERRVKWSEGKREIWSRFWEYSVEGSGEWQGFVFGKTRIEGNIIIRPKVVVLNINLKEMERVNLKDLKGVILENDKGNVKVVYGIGVRNEGIGKIVAKGCNFTGRWIKSEGQVLEDSDLEIAGAISVYPEMEVKN